ncbi:N-carbamoylputrescine amidase [Rhizobium sp. RAF36]|uniref:N-carbamoylputrescine amidase n=1 Tax=Rhizobium sp. RAF36 TaxID=3233055 RepID=UPI003F97655A
MITAGSTVTLGVVQFACSDDVAENIATASRLIREAAADGANIVLVQELFEGLYFCQTQDPVHFARAHPVEEHPVIEPMRVLARDLGIVLPVSFFERKNQAFYNSMAMIDDSGGILGVYRKSHIPDGPGYSEKFYFRPGDTGFKVWQTRFGTIGVGICWDQWFPEAARAMALMGAELILYPTAIGSEPANPALDTMEHWRMVMRGHAAANMVPVAAANRIGSETIAGLSQSYYGSSFISGPDGQLVASASRDEEQVLIASFDRSALAANRAAWGLFRDRRPDLYGTLATADGTQRP